MCYLEPTADGLVYLALEHSLRHTLQLKVRVAFLNRRTAASVSLSSALCLKKTGPVLHFQITSTVLFQYQQNVGNRILTRTIFKRHVSWYGCRAMSSRSDSHSQIIFI